jgi:hypothetical protein
MSERDRARSKDYFFGIPGRNIENRIDEPAHINEARDELVSPFMAGVFARLPPNIQPLSKLGKLLGGNDIAKPTPTEVMRYLANIEALNQPPDFNQRWPDDLQQMGMRPMTPSTERGFASR